MISFLTVATKPLDDQNTIMNLCFHFLITLSSSLFSQQMWEVAISEMG